MIDLDYIKHLEKHYKRFNRVYPHNRGKGVKYIIGVQKSTGGFGKGAHFPDRTFRYSLGDDYVKGMGFCRERYYCKTNFTVADIGCGHYLLAYLYRHKWDGIIERGATNVGLNTHQWDIFVVPWYTYLWAAWKHSIPYLNKKLMLEYGEECSL